MEEETLGSDAPGKMVHPKGAEHQNRTAAVRYFSTG
jgi:hypothetical protein